MRKKWLAMFMVLAILTASLAPLWDKLVDSGASAETIDFQAEPSAEAVEQMTNALADATAALLSLSEPEPTESVVPTTEPTPEPTEAVEPTAEPTSQPIESIESIAEILPETTESVEPTVEPAPETTESAEPTVEPSPETTESAEPTVETSPEPTESIEPTAEPSPEPTESIESTAEPSPEPTESVEPTAEPSPEPTESVEPTVEPSPEPTESVMPTVEPTPQPTVAVVPTAESSPVAPLALQLSVSPDFLQAGEGMISALASISGGTAPYTLNLSVTSPYSLVGAQSFTLGEAGSTLWDCAPAMYGGMHTVTAALQDAAGQTASASACVTVSAPYPETSADWAASVADTVLTGDWHSDLLAVARTQVGYTESPDCFMLDENGRQHAYTRYGHWYGAPYGEWCAMFVAFCLHYAEIPAELYPTSAGCNTWKEKLEQLDAYMPTGEDYLPASGDLVFFIREGSDAPAHIGIVELAANGMLHTIEGNAGNAVRRKEYTLDDPSIAGYGCTAVLARLAGTATDSEPAFTAMAEGTMGYTTIQNVNLRSHTDVNSKRLAQLSEPETMVAVLGCADCGDTAWYYVDCKGTLGYIRSDLLRIESPAPTAEPTIEPTASPIPWLCGLEEHLHTESCADENGALLCMLSEHIHVEACLTAPTAEPTIEPTIEPTAEPTAELLPWLCGCEEHLHTDSCADENGALLCMLSEHIHTEACLTAPTAEPTIEPTIEPTAEPTAEPLPWLCGYEEHLHTDSCADENGALLCILSEHIHTESCLTAPAPTAEPTIEPTIEPTAEPTAPPAIMLSLMASSGSAFAGETSITLMALIANAAVPYSVHFEAYPAADAAEPAAVSDLLISQPGESAAFSYLPETAGTHWLTVSVTDALGAQAQAMYSLPVVELAQVQPEDWRTELAAIPLSGDVRADIITLAQAHMGYQENADNFMLRDGQPHGYTRFGDWALDSYQPWAVPFVQFCLNFAGIPQQPYATAADLEAAMMNAGQFRTVYGYTPRPGDVLFFDWEQDGITDHAGLVGNAWAGEDGTTVITLEGDVDNAVVSRRFVAEYTPSIVGYAQVFNDPVRIVECYGESTSGSTRVTISALTTDAYEEPVMLLFLMRAGEQSLESYVTSHSGDLSLTLLNQNNQYPPVVNGQFILTPGETYNLTLSVSLPNGIQTGSYTYQMPEGFDYTADSGTFMLDEKDSSGNLSGSKVEIGTWTLDTSGKMTFTFNENADKYTEVIISATISTNVLSEYSQIEFDGNVYLIVDQPDESDELTGLQKWGSQGDPAKGQDPNKLYWQIVLEGKADSKIPGTIVTDTITYGSHFYDESDRNAGLVINAQYGEAWHEWHVPGSDLTWTDTGWTYVMPETATCRWCGSVSLGNEGWYYYINYTTTPTDTNQSGQRGYGNTVIADRQETSGWASATYQATPAGVVKDGAFRLDENGGKFYWTITATIPGKNPDEKAVHRWYLWDQMRIWSNENNSVTEYISNDLNQANVTVTYNGQSFAVPNEADATEDDLFAWAFSSTEGNGTVTVDLLCRCTCTEENCPHWYGECTSNEWENNNFCYCWNVEENAVFTFTYETTAPDIIEKYASTGQLVQNAISLNHYIPTQDGKWTYQTINDAYESIPIPNLLYKDFSAQPEQENGYTASYIITVNESRLDLSAAAPLVIEDKLSETLHYVPGTMVITRVNENDERTQLVLNEDYTLLHDHDNHRLVIEILEPGSYKYVLRYDAKILITGTNAKAVPYRNDAKITLFGTDFTSNTGNSYLAEINITAKTYNVKIDKKAADTNSPLAGAVFGLYAANGELIATETTNENGEALFSTSVSQDIILMEHTPYYMQEIASPPHYQLDDTKHWFFFTSVQTECADCHALMDSFNQQGIPITRIPGSHLEVFTITNQLANYQLPEAGGPGTLLYTIAGVLLIAAAAALLYSQIKCRREDSSA